MKILSQNKFRNFDDIIYQGIHPIIVIKFDDETSIRCTLDHRLLLTFDSQLFWVDAQNIEIGDILNRKMVVDLERQSAVPVYDVFNVEDTNSYTVNGIENHNCNVLYVDEVAIIPNNVAEDFFTATYPTISSGKTTKIILTSTPLGYNHFWKFWNEAENCVNGFVPIRVHYWEHPDRDEAWAAKQKELLGELKYQQEILCSFLGSSSTLINSDTLSRLSASPYIYSKDNLDVYERPLVDRIYAMIVDVSKGVGGDYSAFTIIDITETPYRVVAKYRDNYISPLLYPNIIYKMGMEYNGANILIEGNIGEQVGYILYEELEYENILFINRSTNGQSITGGFGSGRAQVGVITDKKVKRIGCSSLKMLIEENKLLIPDGDIISELSTFIETKGSYAADIGYHDDLVMTLVLFGWLVNQPYFKELNNVDLRQMVYQNQMRQIEDTLTPFGFYNDGSEQEPSWSNF